MELVLLGESSGDLYETVKFQWLFTAVLQECFEEIEAGDRSRDEEVGRILVLAAANCLLPSVR